MTARVGALTSATNVVFERVLIVLGTAAGEAMASTRGLMCLMISALGRMEQSVVAHLLAAVETCENVSERLPQAALSTYLGLCVMHGTLDTRNHMSKLLGDPIIGSGLDERLHGLQRADLGPPPFGIVQNGLQQINNLPDTFGRGNLDNGIDTCLCRLTDRLGLVHQDVQEDGDRMQEKALGALTQPFHQSFHQNPCTLPFRGRLAGSPPFYDIFDSGIEQRLGDGLVGRLLDALDECVGEGLGLDCG